MQHQCLTAAALMCGLAAPNKKTVAVTHNPVLPMSV